MLDAGRDPAERTGADCCAEFRRQPGCVALPAARKRRRRAAAHFPRTAPAAGLQQWLPFSTQNTATHSLYLPRGDNWAAGQDRHGVAMLLPTLVATVVFSGLTGVLLQQTAVFSRLLHASELLSSEETRPEGDCGGEVALVVTDHVSF